MKESKAPAHTTTARLHVVDLDPSGRLATPSLPDFLNVREAAKVLRLSRNRTYELAKLYIESGGECGLPAIRFGKPIRIPRLALEAYSGGPITWPPVELPIGGLDYRNDDGDSAADNDSVDADDLEVESADVADASQVASIDSPDQQTLPFEG